MLPSNTTISRSNGDLDVDDLVVKNSLSFTKLLPLLHLLALLLVLACKIFCLYYAVRTNLWNISPSVALGIKNVGFLDEFVRGMQSADPLRRAYCEDDPRL